MKNKELFLKKVETTIAGMARRAAGMEANTTCPLWGYQPKEPQELRNCGNFEVFSISNGEISN